MEYLVRAARITDIDRLVALCEIVSPAAPGASPLGAADLLRQLVYLPQASVIVAESRREIVGGAVLALRPSVRAGGFVGVVDLLVVDPGRDDEQITRVLLEEVLRSARNKACAVVEVARPDDPIARARWEDQGFVDAGPRLTRSVIAATVAASRT